MPSDCNLPLIFKHLRKTLVLVLTGFLLFSVSESSAAGAAAGEDGKFNAGEVIIGHILDTYDWHIADIGQTPISLPLPVILVYDGKPYFFLSSRFHHGHSAYQGFGIAHNGPKKGRIIRVLDNNLTPTQTPASCLIFPLQKMSSPSFSVLRCFALFLSVWDADISAQAVGRFPRGCNHFWSL
jgi:hypothetical protein